MDYIYGASTRKGWWRRGERGAGLQQWWKWWKSESKLCGNWVVEIRCVTDGAPYCHLAVTALYHVSATYAWLSSAPPPLHLIDTRRI